MIRSFQIGDVRVTGLMEYFGPTHGPETFPDFDAERMAGYAERLPAGFWYPAIARFAIAIGIWIVHAGDSVILVDTGVGNAKPRPAGRMNMLNTLVLQWLAAAGAPPERVTHVLMTHLHSDHIGWNTVREDDRWVPTFPNARYLVPRSDFDYFDRLRKTGRDMDESFADSLMPVLDAGLVYFIEDTDREAADVFEVRPAPGHTPGMVNYWLRSGGETGVFCGDVFHHPVQILSPDWNTAFCMVPDQARRARHAFLAAAADAEALVMPCHFVPPQCGYVRREAGGYEFRPAT